MTLLKEENAQSKFNPSSYVETCLSVSLLVLTGVLLKELQAFGCLSVF